MKTFSTVVNLNLHCHLIGKSGLLLDSQHPEGWEKVKGLEARGGRGRLEVEEMPVGPPQFVTELTVLISVAIYVYVETNIRLKPQL